MSKKKNYFIEGVPISSKRKLLIVSLLFMVLILNTVLPVYFESLDYPFNGGISIIIIILMIIFSLGSKLAEGLIIGVAILALASNVWDFFVKDLSILRQKLLIGSIVVLVIELNLGKLSSTNLLSIIKGQLGVSKK